MSRRAVPGHNGTGHVRVKVGAVRREAAHPRSFDGPPLANPRRSCCLQTAGHRHEERLGLARLEVHRAQDFSVTTYPAADHLVFQHRMPLRRRRTPLDLFRPLSERPAGSAHFHPAATRPLPLQVQKGLFIPLKLLPGSVLTTVMVVKPANAFPNHSPN